jgi:hypothetical protein
MGCVHVGGHTPSSNRIDFLLWPERFLAAAYNEANEDAAEARVRRVPNGVPPEVCWAVISGYAGYPRRVDAPAAAWDFFADRLRPDTRRTGRAATCQGWGRGFESLRPLHLPDFFVAWFHGPVGALAGPSSSPAEAAGPLLRWSPAQSPAAAWARDGSFTPCASRPWTEGLCVLVAVPQETGPGRIAEAARINQGTDRSPVLQQPLPEATR